MRQRAAERPSGSIVGCESGKDRPKKNAQRRAAVATARSWASFVSSGTLWLFAFVGRADAGRADEQLLAVGEGDVAAVRAERAVLRLVAFDDDLGAGGQRLLIPAAAQQRV